MTSRRLAESTKRAAGHIFHQLKSGPKAYVELGGDFDRQTMVQGLTWLKGENLIEVDRTGEHHKFFLTNWAKYRRRFGDVETGAPPFLLREWKPKEVTPELEAVILGACSFDYISVMEIADNVCEDVLTVAKVVEKLHKFKQLKKRGNLWICR